MKEKFVKVTWEDAAKGTEESLYDIHKKSINDLTVTRDTYGILVKEDKDGVVLVHDIDSNGLTEYDVIPMGIIHGIKVLKNGVENGIQR